MPQQRWAIVVRGRVQGVGFRYFTRSCARKNGLVGWVKNMPDSSVGIEVQGAMKDLDVFKKAVGDGPVLARVDAIHSEEIPAVENETTFKIVF